MIGLYLASREPGLCNKHPPTVLCSINIHTGDVFRPALWITQTKRTWRVVKTGYVSLNPVKGKVVPVLN
jgi:hypothetical protein